MAYDDARNKVWELEGYLLKEQLHIKQEWKDAYKREQEQPFSLKTGINTLLTTRIPIINQLTDLCYAIEKCGASPELTDAATKAGALREPISELVKQALALGIGDGIVSVSYSNNGSDQTKGLPTGEQLFGEIKPLDPAELPELKVGTGGEPSVNEPRCSGSVVNGHQLNEKRDNAFLVAQLLSNNKISPELRKKAESKMLKLLDELI